MLSLSSKSACALRRIIKFNSNVRMLHKVSMLVVSGVKLVSGMRGWGGVGKSVSFEFARTEDFKLSMRNDRTR